MDNGRDNGKYYILKDVGDPFAPPSLQSTRQKALGFVSRVSSPIAIFHQPLKKFHYLLESKFLFLVVPETKA